MAESRPRLVKLVRDDVGKFLPARTSGVFYAPIDDQRLAIHELRKKLLEEGAEYLLAPSVDELADVLEVWSALSTQDLGVSLAELHDAAWRKRQEKGGFDKLMGMWVD